MCECVENLDRHLAASNTRVATALVLGNGISYPMVVTEKINPRGKKARTVIASACPFCGKKYPSSKTQAVQRAKVPA